MRNIFAAMFMGLFLMGCSGTATKTESTSVPTEAVAKSSVVDGVDYSQRMMSYSVSIDLEVKNRSDAKIHITDKVQKLKGYVVEESRRRIVVNVPSKELAHFVDYLEEIGTITDQDKYGKDVTESHDEISAKLTTLKASRESYMALLKKASAVDDILKIEKELERVNGEIQRLETQKLRIQNSVDYSKVTINLSDKSWIPKAIVGPTLLGALILLIVL